MENKELKEYLGEFNNDSDVSIIVANPEDRKVYMPEAVLLMKDEEVHQPCFIVRVGAARDMDEDIAACSFHDSVRLFRYMWNGMFQGKSIEEGYIQQGNKKKNEKRIHPTQKPVLLYRWLFDRYAERGMKLLDTHVGSASSLIAAHDAGLQCVGFELDKHYYELSKKRLEEHTAQMSLSDFPEVMPK